MMDGFIHVVAIAMIIAYMAFSVWLICTRQTIWAGVGSSVGVLCGGFFIVPIAEAVATFLCWGVVAVIVLMIIGALFR